MFEVGYVSSPKELIVTGWQTVDDDKEYPSIASRNPHLDQTLDDIDEPLDGYAVTNGRSASESSEEDAYPPAGLPSTTRMVDESSSEEDAPLGPRKVSINSFRYLALHKLFLPSGVYEICSASLTED